MEEDAIKGKTCHIKEDNEMVTIPVAGRSQQEAVQITLEEPRSDFEKETNGSPNRELRESRALCASLLQAALKGDWQASEPVRKKNPRCIALRITKERGTALHSAAAAKRTTFVKELVKLMTASELELQTTEGCTALIFAAQSGSVTIAREMVQKNNNLLRIRTNDGKTPLGFAAWYRPRRKKMVSYLFSETSSYQELTIPERTDLLLGTIFSDMYDIALKILEINPELPLDDNTPLVWQALKILEINPEPLDDRSTPIVWDALKMLARKPLAIGSKSRLSMWERCLNACFNRFCNKALMRALAYQLVENLWKVCASLPDEQFLSNKVMALLAEAAKVGNVEFLVILIRSSPDLIWQTDERYGSLFHIAIKYRQEKVFALIYEIGSLKDPLVSIRVNENNMLHLAGELVLVNGWRLSQERPFKCNENCCGLRR